MIPVGIEVRQTSIPTGIIVQTIIDMQIIRTRNRDSYNRPGNAVLFLNRPTIQQNTTQHLQRTFKFIYSEPYLYFKIKSLALQKK